MVGFKQIISQSK